MKEKEKFKLAGFSARGQRHKVRRCQPITGHWTVSREKLDIGNGRDITCVFLGFNCQKGV